MHRLVERLSREQEALVEDNQRLADSVVPTANRVDATAGLPSAEREFSEAMREVLELHMSNVSSDAL